MNDPTSTEKSSESLFSAQVIWEGLGRASPEDEAKALSALWPTGPDGKRTGQEPPEFTAKAAELEASRNWLFKWVGTIKNDQATLDALDIADILHQKPGQTKNAIHLAESLLKEPAVVEALGGKEAAEQAIKVVAFLNLADSKTPVSVIAGDEYTDQEFKDYIKPRAQHAADKYKELGGDKEIESLLRQTRPVLQTEAIPSKIAQFAFTVHSICGIAAKPFAHEDNDVAKSIKAETVVSSVQGNLQMKDRKTGATPGFVHEDLFGAIKNACLQPQFLDNVVLHKRENNLYSKSHDNITLKKQTEKSAADVMKEWVEEEKSLHEKVLRELSPPTPKGITKDNDSQPFQEKNTEDLKSSQERKSLERSWSGSTLVSEPPGKETQKATAPKLDREKWLEVMRHEAIKMHTGHSLAYQYKPTTQEKLKHAWQFIQKKFNCICSNVKHVLHKKSPELKNPPISSLATFSKVTKTGQLQGRVFGVSTEENKEGILVGKNGAKVRDVWLIPASKEVASQFKKGELVTVKQVGKGLDAKDFEVSKGHTLKDTVSNLMEKTKKTFKIK